MYIFKLSHYLGGREMRGGQEVRKVEDFSGAWRKMRIGERGMRREGEMNRRKSLCMGAYDVVSDARERESDNYFEHLHYVL
jgi:hypothetical protein